MRFLIRTRALLLVPAATAALAGCLGPAPTRPDLVERPTLRPERFFEGRTQGKGTLALLNGERRSLRVEGRGTAEADGSLRLEQVVTFEDGTTDERTWRLARSDAGGYSASLSAADGPVSVAVTGNRLHLRYGLRKPAVYMEQWLYLQPDGRTVLNLATITVLGIPWARLTEEIRRTDD